MRSIRAGRILAACICPFVLGIAPASAANHTWIGPAGGNWSVAGNWTGGVPTSGEGGGGTIVTFGSNTSSVMNIAGLTVDEIHFTGANNVINGNGTALSVKGDVQTNNIVADTGPNTLGATMPITLAGTLTVFVKVDANQLTMAGAIGGAAGIRVLGTGASGATLTAAANTYTGATTVSSGTLRLNSGGVNTAIASSTLIVGVSGGPGATLILDQANQIGDTISVLVRNDGTFNLNGVNDAVGPLTILDGTVTLGAGTLTLNGALTMTGGTVSGTSGALALRNDAVVSSSATGTATISAPVTLNGPRAFTVSDGPQATDANLSNAIADGTASSSLAKAGTGTLLLGTAAANTWSGGTQVRDGVLLLNGNSSAVLPANGTVTIGDSAGAAASAVIRLGQLSEIHDTANLVVHGDGRFDLAGFLESIGGLTVDAGDVVVGAGIFHALGTLTMVGGTVTLGGTGSLLVEGTSDLTGATITGGGGGVYAPAADIVATSSGDVPTTIGVGVQLGATRTVTVTPGTPPELVLNAPVTDGGGGYGIVKAGTGVLLTAAANTNIGTTTITGGTLIANGTVPGAVQVAAGGTLAGTGSVGTTTVAGTLAPGIPALATGTLSFAAGGSLSAEVTSLAPAEYPSVTVAGGVTVDPAATVALSFESGLAVPAGSSLGLIDNDGGDGVTGQFANAPAGTPFTLASGLPLQVAYAGGTGNDIVVTAANAAPVVGAIAATPNPSGTLQPVALLVGPTDANGDALTVTWDFGDGATGSGVSTSHRFLNGAHTVTATVSDGTVQSKATKIVTTKDTVKPVLSKARLAATRFKALGKGGSLSATKGMRLLFTLSEQARVTMSVERRQTGRVVGGKCVKRTGANAKRPRCTRYVALAGSFVANGAKGKNTTRFTGRLRGRKLAPASYRLVLTAKDPAGNRGGLVRLAFRITK